MPDLTNGWAEIEIGWPNGIPPASPNSYFGAMVGFRKEIAKEENMEVIPIGDGNGNVDLALEAWVNGGPVIVARWPIPLSPVTNTHIPDPGDIIRVSWQQTDATHLHVLSSYYDASLATWNKNIIDYAWLDKSIGNPGVDFTNGYHRASSITIDTQYYSIRRYEAGTLDSYPSSP